MRIVDIKFDSLDDDQLTIPYITQKNSIKYETHGKEGKIYFNGYYYIENDPLTAEEELVEIWKRPRRYLKNLPRRHMMYIYYEESTYTDAYIIEIYKKETHERTNLISKVEDDAESEMNICFFPTNNLTLHFKIISTLEEYFGTKV